MGKTIDEIALSPEWRALTAHDKEMLGLMLAWSEEVDEPDERPLNIKTFADLYEEQKATRMRRAVCARFKRFADETRETLDERLSARATAIANARLASVAWLFIKRGHGLHALIAHKNRHRDEFLPIDGPGIATHVARTHEPFVAPDVTKVAFYKPFPGMKSAISVPLRSQGGELLGVFHLESTEWNEYREDHIADLTAAVEDLVPPLLMLRALEEEGAHWFPWRSFDLSDQLGTLCHDLRRVLDPNGIQCTIWTADLDGHYLFVHTTTGHAEEYVNSRSLPFESFNGSLLTMPANGTGTARPRQHTHFAIPTDAGVEEREGPHPFLDEWKGSYLKWHMSLGAPLYVRMTGQIKPKAQGTLVLSCFDQEGEAALPPPEDLVSVGKQIGDFITGYLALRDELASTYLGQGLRACRCLPDAFETMLHRFSEFFGLQAVAIDGYLGDDELVEITSGGLGAAVHWVRSCEARNPFKVFRPDILNEHGQRIGTVHLARSRPFTVSDRQLAERLLTMCAPVFETWQAEPDVFRYHFDPRI